MPTCEHFIYTAGKIGTKEGYQIIARSEGISDRIVDNLLEYLFPIGVKSEEFTESRSLLVFDKTKIAYSIIKNLGIGYDGRRGTLYNHTFIINKDDFEKLNYDSRVFESFFIQNPSIRGRLEPIKINTTAKLPRLELLQKLDEKILSEILHALLKKTKIALVKLDDLELIPNLLALLPPPLRLVSFSTLVNDPDKQYKYDLIQIPERAQNKVGRGFTVISHDLTKISKHDDPFNESVQLLVNVVKTKNTVQLEKIFSDFQKISVHVSQVRNIELKEIFNQDEFKHLEKKEKFAKMTQKIQELYSSSSFNQAPTRVVVSITKKLRKTIEHALKRQQKSKTPSQADTDKLLAAVKVLLDCMYYTKNYSGKKISPSTKKDIISEITILEEIMKKYKIKDSKAKFDPYEYAAMAFEQTMKYSQALLRLWFVPRG
ncbi:MAG: hypothetical protein WAN47_11195 [Nitrosotalea sp.]